MSGRKRERDLGVEINNMTSDSSLKVATSEITICLTADVESGNPTAQSRQKEGTDLSRV